MSKRFKFQSMATSLKYDNQFFQLFQPPLQDQEKQDMRNVLPTRSMDNRTLSTSERYCRTFHGRSNLAQRCQRPWRAKDKGFSSSSQSVSTLFLLHLMMTVCFQRSNYQSLDVALVIFWNKTLWFSFNGAWCHSTGRIRLHPYPKHKWRHSGIA